MDQLDICKVGSWGATVSQLSGISEPEDWVTPPGCLACRGCFGMELPRPSDRKCITTCQKMIPVHSCSVSCLSLSEGCGLIARLGDAMRCLQPPVVLCIFEADAGQVRSLTSLRFQASRSRNWLEQIVHAAALETPQSQKGIVLTRTKRIISGSSHERTQTCFHRTVFLLSISQRSHFICLFANPNYICLFCIV